MSVFMPVPYGRASSVASFEIGKYESFKIALLHQDRFGLFLLFIHVGRPQAVRGLRVLLRELLNCVEGALNLILNQGPAFSNRKSSAMV